MAFQFQSIAALSPLMSETYALSLADIGLLIGFGETWAGLVAGRLVAGVGGVVINVVMTKMVVDWFTGHEISTALAIFINSWPAGIALALLILPGLASVGGLAIASSAVLTLITVSLTLFLLFYRSPAAVTATAGQVKPSKFPTLAIFLSGAVWALYNAALAMVFSFGPSILSQRGLSLTSASFATSLFMIVLAIAIPIGGVIADRTGKQDAVVHLSLVSFVVLMPLVLFVPVATVTAIFLVAGFLFGLGAGPIIAMPSSVLPDEAKSFAMGVYFTIYYLWMMAAPSLAGALADSTGNVGLIFVFGAAMAALAMVAQTSFRATATALVRRA